jgi:tetratricopeptide (TPR) repeat protein
VLLAACLHANGELAEADREFALVPEYAYDIDVLDLHVGTRYLRMDYAGAKELIAAFTARDRQASETQIRINALHRRLSDNVEGLRLLRQVVRGGARQPAILAALLEHLAELGEPAEALAAAEQVVSQFPLNARAHFFLGNIRLFADDPEGAGRAYRAALFLNRQDAPSLVQLGLIAEERGEFRAALTLYDRSLDAAEAAGRSRNVRAMWHSVMNAVMCGETERAVATYGRICEFFNQTFPGHVPLWRGEPLAGRKLLIAVRGGPGDEVRVASTCIPALIESGIGRCTFACDPRLESLLCRSFPEISFVPTLSGHRQLRRSESDPSLRIDRAWPGVSGRTLEMAIPFDRIDGQDFVCHSDTLTHRFFFETVMAHGAGVLRRYLTPDLQRRREMRTFLHGLGPGLKVGICWRGTFFNQYRYRGFLEFADVAPLLDVPGVQFVNLQVNRTADENRDPQAARIHVVHGLDLYDDFEGVAALMAELDLVLAPGVTTRDLAGAVNVPTWSFTAAPGAGDVWRKDGRGYDRWQPAVRHFDLLTYGSRAALIAAMAAELDTLSRQHASASVGRTDKAVAGAAAG